MGRSPGSGWDDLLIALIEANDDISSTEIQEIMEAQYDAPEGTIKNALKQLVERGRLEISKEGGRGRATLYRTPDRWSPDYYDGASEEEEPEEDDADGGEEYSDPMNSVDW